MEDQRYIDELVARSREAGKVLEEYTQEQVDEIAKALARTIFEHAEPLAKMAVEETRMGVYEDKIKKNQGKSRIIWNSLRGKKSVGVIEECPDQGIIKVAKPMGVVCAVMPCTNPIVTPMSNAMFAIKCRDTIIVAPHPRSKKCTLEVKRLFDIEFDRLGVPRDVFLVTEEPSIERTRILMQTCDVVIATGGMGMVKSAYSSGKPSYGVGAGNVQGLYDEGIDLMTASAKAIASRIFDNGIICSGDQTIIAPKTIYKDLIDAFVAQGAFYVDDPEQVKKAEEALFPNGVMNKNLVGQSVAKVAEAMGLAIPEGTKLIILKAEGFGKGHVLSKEKMCPVMSAYEYDKWEDGVAIAKANLLVEGAGHSVSIQSNNKDHILYAGLHLPVSRVLINQICATMNGGAFTNALSPTTTLGCGSWGNNSVSENLTYYHLMNVSRIAYEMKDWKQPSDEEIWK